jgi:hypothetical protein
MRKEQMTPKTYSGRLAFDSDTGFHVATRTETKKVTIPAETAKELSEAGLLTEGGTYNTDGSYSVSREVTVIGAQVVTKDKGKTWHIATEEDESHFDRHHEAFAGVDGTANRLAELQLEHGREKAEEIMRAEQPHHFEPTKDDPHYEEGARDSAGAVTHTRTRSTPDAKSVKATGHTEAWKNV